MSDVTPAARTPFGVAGVGVYRFVRPTDVSLRAMAYRAGTAAMTDAA